MRVLPKLHEGRPNALDLITNGEIQLIINTPLGKVAREDEADLRREALVRRIPFITTLSAAVAVVRAIQALSDSAFQVRSLQEYHGAGGDGGA